MSEPATPVRWRNVVVLSGTIIFTLTGIFGWHRVLPLYLRELHAADGQIAVGYLLLAFANRIPQLFGGWLADRVGRKRIVVVITALMGCCYAAIGLATSWPAVFALIALCWILGGLQWPALLSLVADSVPESRRGRAVGALETASMFGWVAGPLLGTMILDRTRLMDGGWTLLLFLCAGFYFVAAVARGLFLFETVSAGSEGSLLSKLGGVDWRILAFPLAAAILAVSAFTLSVDGPFQSFYLSDVNRMTEARVNEVNFYGGIVALTSAMLAGWISDRLGSIRVIQGSFAAAALLLLPFALPADLVLGAHPWIAVASIVALFAPLETFTVAYHKLVTSVSPPGSRALYIGVAGLATGLTVPWVNPMGEWVYRADSTHRAPFAAAFAISVLGLAVSLAAARWRRRAAPVLEPRPERKIAA